MAKQAKGSNKKPNVLFDLLSALFNNRDYVNNLTEESMRQNIFMVNRRLAIKYPLQAQVFNNGKVNARDVIKFWNDYLYNGKFPPKWIYTPGAAKSKENKEKETKISMSLKKSYCNHYHISIKDLDAALRFFMEDTLEELKAYENLLKHLKDEETN